MAGEDRPTTVNALVYAFYGLVVLVVVAAALWLLGVVPGWVVPAVVMVTVIVFVLLWRALDRSRRPALVPPAESPGEPRDPHHHDQPVGE